MIFNSISIRSSRTGISDINANKTKQKRSKSKKKSTISVIRGGVNPLTPPKRSRNSLRIQTGSLLSSLGTGELGKDGSVVSFMPSPSAKSRSSCGSFFSCSDSATSVSGTALFSDGIASTMSSAKSRIIGKCCSFLRVSDLEMDDESIATMSVTSDMSNEEHSLRPVVNPPPGIEIDPKERWVALSFDDSGGTSNSASTSSEHTPIAPLAVGRLANFGLSTTLNDTMWQPDSKSEKLIRKASDDGGWMTNTFSEGLKEGFTASDSLKDVLIWSGSFKHGFYGSDVPALRSAGVMETSAKKLMELLVDSTRVKEYNKLSLGRTDLVTFDGTFEEDGPFGKTITKVMRSTSKPPMLSAMALTSILHAKKLSDGSGYLIVTRAVHRPEDEPSVASSAKTEIVMGVNLILDFDDNIDGSERCLMVNVSHMRSPMVPMYIAKKLAVTTAFKFINDIRALV